MLFRTWNTLLYGISNGTNYYPDDFDLFDRFSKWCKLSYLVNGLLSSVCYVIWSHLCLVFIYALVLYMSGLKGMALSTELSKILISSVPEDNSWVGEWFVFEIFVSVSVSKLCSGKESSVDASITITLFLGFNAINKLLITSLG